MSVWYEVADQEDVELSEDGEFLCVLFDSGIVGKIYGEIPLKFIMHCVHNKPVELIASSCDHSEATETDRFCPKCMHHIG